MALRLIAAVRTLVLPPRNFTCPVLSSAAWLSSGPTTGFLPTRDKFSPIGVSDVTFVPGSMKRRRIIGRGDGSTRGNMCGRGNKGQKARSKGPRPRVAYSGGQYPFYLFPPKIERPKCPLFRMSEGLCILTLGRLQQWIDAGRIDPKKTITMHELVNSGVVSKSCIRRNGVRIVDENVHLLHTPVNIEVTQFSNLAAYAIEQCGGKAVAVWFAPPVLRALILPVKCRLLPRPQQPKHPAFIDYYYDKSNRGYLALGVEPTYPAPTAGFYRGLETPVYAPDLLPIPRAFVAKFENIDVERAGKVIEP